MASEPMNPGRRNPSGPEEHVEPARRKVEELATELLVLKGRMASVLRSESRQDQTRASVQPWFDHFGYSLDRAAGGKMQEADSEAREGRFAQQAESPKADGEVEDGRQFSLDTVHPPYDPGPWPEGFTVSRAQIYDVDGR